MPRKTKKKSKQTIPKAVREQVWRYYFGSVYKHSCYVKWCDNEVDVFNYHVGHNKPESKGGKLNIMNLRPICSRCNHSMGNKYTIKEWNNFNKRPKKKWWCCFL